MVLVIYIIGYVIAYVFLKLAKVGNNTWDGILIRFLTSFLSWVVPLTFFCSYIASLPVWKRKPPFTWL